MTDAPIAVTTILTDDEQKWINEHPNRCSCGHLYVFHNDHCCSFCMVDGCDCGDNL